MLLSVYTLVTSLFIYPPLKTSENQRFSGVFRWYKKRQVAGRKVKVIVISLLVE